MHVIFLIIAVFVVLFVLFVFVGCIRTWQVQHSKEQKEFLKGKFPHPLPDGFYHGHVHAYAGPWVGKTFDKNNERGMNVFSVGDKNTERFPFRIFKGKGVQDRTVDVLKIEYNIPENSYFLKMILDEIVETESGKYLGKAHIRCVPFFPFTVGFFWLEKE